MDQGEMVLNLVRPLYQLASGAVDDRQLEDLVLQGGNPDRARLSSGTPRCTRALGVR